VTPDPIITLVAAVARNGTIGADGGLPWHLPADLQRFKALTMGHTMIMGRRTYESIGRALPGRRTIVVTHDPAWRAPDVTIAHSVDEAIDLAGPDGDSPDGHSPDGDGPARSAPVVMVVGGGEIYRQTMHRAHRLEITHVNEDIIGDTSFPDIDPTLWQVSDRQDADGYAFVSYTRREPVRDLALLLSTMDPVLHDGEFLFCTLPAGITMPAELRPVATISEPEGLTLVLPTSRAETAGLAGTFRCAWITLRVGSALEAVGLTAAVATALTRDGIACNVIAGFHHDHLFVPVEAATSAMSALAALAHTEV